MFKGVSFPYALHTRLHSIAARASHSTKRSLTFEFPLSLTVSCTLPSLVYGQESICFSLPILMAQGRIFAFQT